MNSSSDDFLAAMLSAATNHDIVTFSYYKSMLTMNDKRLAIPGLVHPLDLNSYHQINLVSGPVQSNLNPYPQFPSITSGPSASPLSTPEDEHWSGQIIIKTLSGKTINVPCSSSDTVGRIKLKIELIHGIPSMQQRLMYFGLQLFHAQKTLSDYNIYCDSILHLVVHLPNGGFANVIFLPMNLRAPEYDYDFTGIKDKGMIFRRGECIYRRPVGMIRLALNVLGKFDDDQWLGVKGRKSMNESAPDEWPVSFHGTGKHNLKSIAEEGYLLSKGKRFTFGYGIYTTPDINVAELYATEFAYNGELYKFIFQNRVNPKSVSVITVGETGIGEYWVTRRQEDVRPYGICIKKCTNSKTKKASCSIV